MKIRISDIGPDGLSIQDVISAKNLNQRMNEGSPCDIEFTHDPKVNLMIYQTPTGAETRGKVRARYRQPCSLCIKEIDRELEIKADFIFQKKPISEESTKKLEDDSYIEDVGISYFSGDHIEIEDLIQESIILSLEQFWRPPQSTDGSCTVCCLSAKEILGKYSEGSQTLGQLFKVVGVK